MISLIPNNDSGQALRIRRALLALSGYFVIFLATLICHYGGMTINITLGGIFLLYLSLVMIYIVVFLLIFSGLNLKFKDPSLTVFQLFIAICWAAQMAYFTSPDIRGSITTIYILMFMYGIFQLRFREFLALVAMAVMLYVFSMMLLYHNHPESVEVMTEIVRAMILFIALLWVSYISTYVFRLRQKVKLLATRDPLTNIYNRREILEILKREKAFSDRLGFPFTLCILDLDDFKRVNDTYGHQAGDNVLKAFTRTIKMNVRAEDYVGRYGGEEFFVIFVSIDCNDCNPACVERLLSATRRLTFPDIDKDLRLTISIGATAYIQNGVSVDGLISRADEALYRAKSGGKDRVEYSMPVINPDL